MPRHCSNYPVLLFRLYLYSETEYWIDSWNSNRKDSKKSKAGSSLLICKLLYRMAVTGRSSTCPATPAPGPITITSKLSPSIYSLAVYFVLDTEWIVKPEQILPIVGHTYPIFIQLEPPVNQPIIPVLDKFIPFDQMLTGMKKIQRSCTRNGSKWLLAQDCPAFENYGRVASR